MKKRFMSLLLAVVMAFGVVSPSFAAGTSDNGSEIEPFNNRYYYTYEEDDTWDTVKRFTITEKEAKDKEAFKKTLTALLATYFASATAGLASDMVEAVISAGIEFASSNDPYKEWGEYTVYQKNGYRYQVDRLTGKKTVTDRYLIVHCELNQNGKILESDHKLHLK